MRQHFNARRDPKKPACNLFVLKQSVIELRSVYSNLTEDEYAMWYQNRYGIKKDEVKRILGSVENEN